MWNRILECYILSPCQNDGQYGIDNCGPKSAQRVTIKIMYLAV